MKMLFVTSVALALLVGCSLPEYALDQELRVKRFNECMASLPAGPEETMYNDWDEVVYECRQTATYFAQRCVANCPKFK